MSFWGAPKCPTYIKILNNIDTSIIFFNYYSKRTFYSIAGRVLARKRFGPHNYETLSLLFGTLLGDSYAELRNSATRIHFNQESHNFEYLMYCWNLLNRAGYCSDSLPIIQERKGLTTGEIRYVGRFKTFSFQSLNLTTGEIRYVGRFKTFSFQSLNWVHDSFNKPYSFNPNKLIKIVPESYIIYYYLSPLALAFWIMDDGCWQGSGLKIATNSFSLDDNIRLKVILSSKFNLNVFIV